MTKRKREKNIDGKKRRDKMRKRKREKTRKEHTQREIEKEVGLLMSGTYGS